MSHVSYLKEQLMHLVRFLLDLQFYLITDLMCDDADINPLQSPSYGVSVWVSNSSLYSMHVEPKHALAFFSFFSFFLRNGEAL